jgi:hypothetical protein
LYRKTAQSASQPWSCLPAKTQHPERREPIQIRQKKKALTMIVKA